LVKIINNMKIDYIIPTLYRDTLERAKNSIRKEDVDYNILTCGAGNTAAENRNKCLSEVKDSDWIVFLDDDDYLLEGHSLELTDDYDIVVLRMRKNRENVVIPRVGDDELRCGNVGINFALRTEFYLQNRVVFNDMKPTEEDFRFLHKIMRFTNRIKVTDKIYYIVPD
jgi:glycosyltransferase involved in cell wall biosynthesis